MFKIQKHVGNRRVIFKKEMVNEGGFETPSEWFCQLYKFRWQGLAIEHNYLVKFQGSGRLGIRGLVISPYLILSYV